MPETADYYRERKIGCVIFPGRCRARDRVSPLRERGSGAQLAAREHDIMIPFASIDPAKGKAGRARGAAAGARLRRPRLQVPSDHAGLLPERPQRLRALRGDRGGGAIRAVPHRARPASAPACAAGMGMRLKYSNPIYLDDVAVDFPDMPIILAHPSFPWQEEALSVATHKPNVYIDLSGWSPKYFPADPGALRQHAPEAQDAVRLGLARDHARPLAGRFREDRDQRERCGR